MIFNESHRNELSLLVLLSLEGKINQEGFDRLSSMLKTMPQARRCYLNILDICLGLEDMEVQSQFHEEGLPVDFNPAVLKALAEYERIAPTTPAAAPLKEAPEELVTHVRRTPADSINKTSVFTALSSLAAMVFLVVFIHLLPPKTATYVGRLSRATGAKWAAVNGAIEPGSDLCPGPLNLLEGAAEITLSNGAVLILEAPALVELETPSRIFLNRGRLVAVVENNPEDRFVVRTPYSTIVDFGTEFGVQVDGITTKTHVFRGQIELRSGADPLKYDSAVTLSAEQAGEVNAHGHIQQLEMLPETFLRRPQFDTLELAARGQRYYLWKAFSDQLHRDPALVAHYTFEQRPDSEERLTNLAPLTRNTLHGTLGEVGSRPQWVEGRWPQKQALRFDREMNQRVVVPAQEALSITGPLTVAAWIYLEPGDYSGHLLSCRDRLNVNYQFGWLSDNHPDKPHRNRIQLLRYAQERTQRGYSPVVTLIPGMWHCLAATHDTDIVRFYLNGVFLSEVADSFNAEPAAAELVIGDVPFEGMTNWRFDGTVDEIVIMNRVMTSAELQTMYQSGKP